MDALPDISLRWIVTCMKAVSSQYISVRWTSCLNIDPQDGSSRKQNLFGEEKTD